MSTGIQTVFVLNGQFVRIPIRNRTYMVEMRSGLMEHAEAIRLRLRAARENRQLTQQDVADLMSISRDYYQKVESGSRTPNLRFVERFCQAVGALPSEILADATPMDELMQKWPEGFRILRRAAEGPEWQRDQLQKLFEAVYGDNNDRKSNKNPESP